MAAAGSGSAAAASGLGRSVDDDEDLDLTVPAKLLLEEFHCPICFSHIREAYITPCGHNFCHNCILECLNRKHACPCCQKETTRERLVKNHQFDQLLLLVVAEKEKSAKRYFERLTLKRSGPDPPAAGGPSAAVGAGAGAGAAPPKATLSAVEEAAQRHLRRLLASYEEHRRELQEALERRRARLAAATAAASSSAADTEARRTQLERAFADSLALLQQTYERHLAKLSEPPTSPPVPVTLALPGKNIRFEGVVLGPSDTVRQVREALRERLAAAGNALLSVSPNAIWLLRRGGDDAPPDGDVILQDEARSLLAYRPEPGALVYLRGDVQLSADLPRQCFALTWSKGQRMDYMKCKDCNLNWLCGPCVETCHKGHAVSVYLKDHAPDWACCYCTRGGKCRLQPAAGAKKK